MLNRITDDFGAGSDFLPAGVDTSRLDKIYDGLRARGLSDDEVSVAMSYMLEDSGANPFRDDESGFGLVDGVDFNDNMFIEDEDSVLERQLDSVVSGVRSGDLDLDVPVISTEYGYNLQNAYANGGRLHVVHSE